VIRATIFREFFGASVVLLGVWSCKPSSPAAPLAAPEKIDPIAFRAPDDGATHEVCARAGDPGEPWLPLTAGPMLRGSTQDGLRYVARLTDGTRVRLVDWDSSSARVVVTNGPFAGKEGFASWRYLRRVDFYLKHGEFEPRRFNIRIRLHNIDVEDPCDLADVRTRVALRRGSIKACYDQQLALPSGAPWGNVDVRWTIDSEGKPQDASVVTTTIGNSALETCVLRNVTRMTFPKTKAGACVVTWHLSFKAITNDGSRNSGFSLEDKAWRSDADLVGDAAKIILNDADESSEGFREKMLQVLGDDLYQVESAERDRDGHHAYEVMFHMIDQQHVPPLREGDIHFVDDRFVNASLRTCTDHSDDFVAALRYAFGPEIQRRCDLELRACDPGAETSWSVRRGDLCLSFDANGVEAKIDRCPTKQAAPLTSLPR
jgi:hypothetical protein